MAKHQEYQAEWWKGRNDGERPGLLRWHQVVHPWGTGINSEGCLAILGFCCDEGVRRNQGRMGAYGGPEKIRMALGSLPVHKELSILDAGNVVCDDEDLIAAQKLLSEKVSQLLSGGSTPVILGGGHETAWGHYQGIMKYLDGQRKSVGVINLDAHFDLREPATGNQPTSGSSFRHMYNYHLSRNEDFHYLALGIQRHGNTPSLFDFADQIGVGYLYDRDLHEDNLDHIKKVIQTFAGKVDHIYLTICMDVFNVAFAPGVSAINVSGIQPGHVVYSILKIISETGKLLSADVAEVNPVYDIDDRTSRLAAFLLFELFNME